MNKLLGIVVLGLLWCIVSLSDEIIILSRCYVLERNDGAQMTANSFDEMENFLVNTKRKYAKLHL